MHLVTLGAPGVLWGPSEFTLDPMGWFCDVILRRAALGTKYECLFWALLSNIAVCARYRENSVTFLVQYNMHLLGDLLQKKKDLPFALCTMKRISGLVMPSASVGSKL